MRLQLRCSVEKARDFFPLSLVEKAVKCGGKGSTLEQGLIRSKLDLAIAGIISANNIDWGSTEAYSKNVHTLSHHRPDSSCHGLLSAVVISPNPFALASMSPSILADLNFSDAAFVHVGAGIIMVGQALFGMSLHQA